MPNLFRKSLQKRFSKTIGNIAGLVKGRSYKKLAEKTGINNERLKAIRQGKVEPDKKEIAKIASFNWEKEKAKEKAKKEKEKGKGGGTGVIKRIKITPDELSSYVGFSAKIIKERMQPAFKFHPKLAEKTKITTLYKEKGKYVTGRRKNGQDLYYYVTIDIKKNKNEDDIFGHNFMVKENAEHMMKEEGDVCHHIYKNSEGEIYAEKIIIFNVLTFKKLAESYKKKKLQNWQDVPPAKYL
jgi:transcriptional regulator with XRE-family HTH domain